MADEMQMSPLMAALTQVGQCTEQAIAQAQGDLDEKLNQSNDALRKIVDDNFREFETKTSQICGDHDAHKNETAQNLTAVRESISAASELTTATFGEHKELIVSLQQMLETVQADLTEEKSRRKQDQEEMQKAHEAAIARLEEDVSRKHAEINERHDKTNAKFTDLMQEANEGMEQIVKRLETQTSETKEYVAGVEAVLRESQEDIRTHLTKQVEKAEADSEEARQKLEETIRSECEALSADIDNACEDYQNLIGEVRRQLEIKFTETEIKIVDAEQKSASVTAETAAQLDAHNTQINFLKGSLKSVEDEGTKRRDELKTIVQGLVMTEKSERETRERLVEQEMQSLKSQLEGIQATLRDELQLTKTSTEQKLNSIMSATQRNIMGLKEDQQAQKDAIESAKSKLESRLETLKNVHEQTSSHLSSLAGKRNWVNDKEVDNCQCCNRRFNLTVRKHHCRMCGNVVCYNCSKWRRKIPGQTRLQRVCDTCIRNRSPTQQESGEFTQDESGRDRESLGPDMSSEVADARIDLS